MRRGPSWSETGRSTRMRGTLDGQGLLDGESVVRTNPISIGPPDKPTSLSDYADESAIRAALSDQLTQVRTAADGWQKGIAGLLTILTSVLFLKGTTSIDKLSHN